MRREALLAAGVVAVGATLLAVATLAPGALADDEGGGDPAGELSFEELTLEPRSVSGETVELHLDTRLTHRGGLTENVTVELRATDAETGLRESTEQLAVRRVDGDRELALDGSIVVDRDAAYRLEAIVYEDGRRIAVGATRVEGLDGLEPDYAELPVEFHRFSRSSLPSVEYRVRSVQGGQASVDVSAYLTNRGNATQADVQVTLLARQTDSNIVADRQTVTVSELAAGQTATPAATLSVPDDYNYYLDAILYSEGTIVDTVREPASLDPGEEPPASNATTGADGGVRTEDFEVEEEAAATTDPADETGTDGDLEDGDRDEAGGDGQPGFGTGAAVVGLLLALLAAARVRGRRTDEDQR